jgi:hypothetical protein
MSFKNRILADHYETASTACGQYGGEVNDANIKGWRTIAGGVEFTLCDRHHCL